MNTHGMVSKSTIIALSMLFMFGCGGNVSLGDLPVFPGAEELTPSNSQLGNTLKNNMETDKKIRESMGPMAAKGSVEQKGYALPSKAQWKDVKNFYDKKLTSLGWQSGLGGVAGKFVDINQAMNAGGSNSSHTIIYSKGKQTLSIIMISTGKRQIILSLSTT